MRPFLCFGGLFLAVALPSLTFFATGKVLVVFGQALVIEEAPKEVKLAISGANRIAGKPYKYSGGHEDFEDEGYDCSGSVSFVLHEAGLLEAARPSAEFLEWGEEGPGQWITVYARSGHVFIVIGGARFDTTDHDNIGPGWRLEERLQKDFVARHPKGL